MGKVRERKREKFGKICIIIKLYTQQRRLPEGKDQMSVWFSPKIEGAIKMLVRQYLTSPAVK